MEATRDLKPRREECCHLANTTDLTIVHPGFLPHLPIHNFFSNWKNSRMESHM